MTVHKEMLSDYSRKILDREGMTIGKVEKLIPNLKDKEKYVLHHQNLNLYLRLGLKLKKFIVLWNFHKAIGWNLILLLIHKNEQRLKMLLKKTFSS